MENEQKTAVVVTTEHRGVFFGYVLDDSKSPEEITLEQARMCIYWSTDVKGILGLAATGPTKGCRITFPVPSFKVYKVTSVIKCTPEATKNWEANLWS